MIYWQLFLSFVQVGMFSIGGGYAAMPLIQSQVVEQHAWLTMQEFTDLITIAEMTPGPIAVNSATFVGLRIASLPGAIIATLGCITPALIFVSLLSIPLPQIQKSFLAPKHSGLSAPSRCRTDSWRRLVHSINCSF